MSGANGGKTAGRPRVQELCARILVADDHPIVRRGLRSVFAGEPGLDVGGEAGDGEEVLCAVRTGDYDLVILDVSMPGMGGLEVLKRLHAERPDLPVLMLSAYAEEQYASRALKAGAAGYVTKEMAPRELRRAVRKALDGGTYVSEKLAERLVADLRSGLPQAPEERLSDREYEVMLALAAGRSVTEIATGLFLSVKTVSTYRARVLDKLGLRTNAELVRYALAAGLIE